MVAMLPLAGARCAYMTHAAVLGPLGAFCDSHRTGVTAFNYPCWLTQEARPSCGALGCGHWQAACAGAGPRPRLRPLVLKGMGNFNHGDRVCMFVATQKVAIGTVFEINPSAYCSGMLIGEGNVSVSVDLCFEKKAIVSFPTMDALIVGDAFHSIVKWSSGSLQHINEMQYKGASMHEADKAEGALDAQCNGMSYREVWKDKRVQLWDESKTHVVAEGVVMYVCPFDSVNFGELGEDNIGIGIETSYADEATIFAEASVCSINLVCWPIKRVTTMDGKALLRYEDLHAMHELQDACIESPYLVEPISKKQKYCFVNRKPK
ncbi:hypothetical protein L7F22_003971, partial [Adiantum nelumboides]|nr:hypothetical protein [Adiantum nelumboides]